MSRAPAALGIGTAAFLPGYGLPAATRQPASGGGDVRSASDPAPGEALLRAAVAAGLRYLDTAAGYGDGERAVGRAVADGVRVCTKIACEASIDHVRLSVARLGVAADTVLMHSATQEQIVSAPAVAALRAARDAGLTARAGASTYGAEAARCALAQGWVDVVQVEYSILNQSVIRAIGPVREDQEVVVRSVLCKGLLTSRRTAAPRLVEQVADALATLDQCARDWERSRETLAIRFALDTPGIDIVLVGVENVAELDAALAAARSPRLTGEQWARLAALDRAGTDAAHPERWEAIS